MAYTKQTWADLPAKTTPINASRLGHIEQGIYDAADAADTANTAIAGLATVASTGDYDDLENKPTLGTAAAKDSTNAVTQNSTDLVESGAVYSAIGTAKDGLVDKSDIAPVQSSATAETDYYQGDEFYLESILYRATTTISQGSAIVTSGSGQNCEIAPTVTEQIQSGVESAYQLVKDTVGWSGKNQGYFVNKCVAGNDNDGYNMLDGGSSLIAKIDNNVQYVASRKHGVGARFRIVLFKHEPSSATSTDTLAVVFNNDLDTYSFNSGSYNYAVFTYDNATLISQDMAEAMIRRADILDSSYEPYHPTVDEQKCDNTVIAPVENGSTASQAYAVGEHFIRDGAFCTCKQAISQGGSFTLNTNYTAGDVATQFGLYIPIANNAGFHNSIFRGKNLGSTVTTAQRNAIQAGTFEDMYIGDYWEINSVKYCIAHFDYWLNCGDTGGVGICTSHHVVVVPDSALVNKRMNAKVDNVDTTAGAYVNSEMRTTNLADAKTIVNTAFGADNILTHREYMQNAVTDGYESAGAWVNADIELMSEIMVYGSNIFHNVKCGTAVPNLYTVNKTQFALFRLDPSFIICKNVAQTDRSSWWLRDVVSAAYFAFVGNIGGADKGGASGSYGVRPAFGIK